MMRILVTGGTGFIGRHVVEAALRRGHEVRVLSRRADAEPASPRVSHLSVDLRDGTGLPAALSGTDVVVHCAAALDGDIAYQRAVTVEGTRHLLAGMAAAGVRRIIGLSSFAVYDMAAVPEGGLLDEDAPIEPQPWLRAPYIAAKLEQEALIRTQPSVDWTILRPGLVFGPDRTWFHHLGVQLAPRRWLCFSPRAVLPLTHVSNCADAVLMAVENHASSGAILNVVDDELPDRREYLAALRMLQRPQPTVSEVPWAMLRECARVSSGVNRLLFRGRAPLPDLLRTASLHSRCKPLRYSNAGLKSLGWHPAVRWTEGLRAAFA
jgi:nucleoside-diphosphate-sugar epimerase